jgi:hypothetical protein
VIHRGRNKVGGGHIESRQHARQGHGGPPLPAPGRGARGRPEAGGNGDSRKDAKKNKGLFFFKKKHLLLFFAALREPPFLLFSRPRPGQPDGRRAEGPRRLQNKNNGSSRKDAKNGNGLFSFNRDISFSLSILCGFA